MASLAERGLRRARRYLREKAEVRRVLTETKSQAPAVNRTTQMNAIIHIGEPKSGTTSIQSFLLDNVEGLAAKGFRYHRNMPRRPSQIEYPLGALLRSGQLPLAENDRKRYNATSLKCLEKFVDPYLQALKAYPQRWPEPTALFSSEHVKPWMHSPELVRAFDDMFAEAFGARVYILYLRDPVDQAISGFSQRIKVGQSVTFDQHLEDFARFETQGHTAMMWSETLGRDRVNVRLMDRTFLKNGDLIDDFAAACGVDLEGLKRPERTNESLTALGIEVLWALNRRIPELLADGTHNPLRHKLLGIVEEKTAHGPRFIPTPEQMARLEEIVKPSNDALRETFFPDRAILYQSARAGKQGVQPESTIEEALDVMTEIIVDLRLRNIPAVQTWQRSRAVTREPGNYREE
jgi:hypothetical protein